MADHLGVEPVEPPEPGLCLKCRIAWKDCPCGGLPPPGPDAEEVRRALAHAKHWHGDREWVLTLAAAAAAWLRERERKQGGGA